MRHATRVLLVVVPLLFFAVACRGTPAHDATAATPASDSATSPAESSDVPAPETTTPAPPAASDATAVPSPEAVDETPAPPPETPAISEADRASALREMRAALDEIRAAAADAEVVNDRPVRVEVLVGMTRDAIRAALGAPGGCEEDVSFDAEGRGHPVAPCEAHEDWYYSFYHLPETWVGGGPELLLQFDANGVCTSAGWRHTQ